MDSLIKNKRCLTMLVFLIVPLSGVCIDIYVPSLPAVCQYFSATASAAQYTITAYLLGLGLTQLIAGSISDSFGRKKPFVWNMLAFVCTNFLIPFSPNIATLILLRFIQGVVLALFIVPMRSVISDLYEGRALQTMMTYMTIAWSLGPIIAPALGGMMQYYLGWKANFYALGIYSLILFLLSLVFHFESSESRHPFQLQAIITRYQSMLSNRQFTLAILMGGVLFSIISLYALVGPFLIQIVLSYSAAQFGQVSLVMGGAWFLGSMINRLLLQIPLAQKTKFSLCAMLITALCMLLHNVVYGLHIYNILIPMACIFFFSGILYPSYFIRTVLLFRQFSASANALYNAAAFFISGCITALGTLIQLHSALPFSTVLIVLIGLCLFFYKLDRGESHA